MEVKLFTVQCKRCRHVWVPRKAEIRLCAKCKSPYWDRERKERSPRRKK